MDGLNAYSDSTTITSNLIALYGATIKKTEPPAMGHFFPDCWKEDTFIVVAKL